MSEELDKILASLNIYIKRICDEAIKAGFYAGQAMAGVELNDCHTNWKKWNAPHKKGK